MFTAEIVDFQFAKRLKGEHQKLESLPKLKADNRTIEQFFHCLGNTLWNSILGAATSILEEVSKIFVDFKPHFSKFILL